MRLKSSDPAALSRSMNRLPGKVNYYLGQDRNAWREGLPTFERVQYDRVYPGIDVAYYGKQGLLEYDFIVHKGADPNRIRLSFDGADRLEVDAAGNVVVAAGERSLSFRRPHSYQEIDGTRREVKSEYRITRERDLAFQIGPYDRSRPLVIDPVLAYSLTLNGATSSSFGYGVAVDAAGSVYLTGGANASDFPTLNSIQGYAASTDVFVAKLNAAGTALVYSTYLGGEQADNGYNIDIDNSGKAYITGVTASTHFPVLNAFQSTSGGGNDAFVAALSATGGLIYSTYLGGSLGDTGYSIRVDKALGTAYVAGTTSSTNFPVLAAVEPVIHGTNSEGFVAKFDSSGTRIFSTYLGGGGNETAYALALDSSNNIYITGQTSSTDFPVTGSAYKNTYGGNTDAFVTKLSSDGAVVLYSTFLGGASFDSGRGIAVDASGNAYVSGYTSSTNFPTVSPSQAANGGGYDLFLSKLNPAGSSLLFSTYLGGRRDDTQNWGALALDSGNVYLAGQTYSDDLPVSNPVQGANGGLGAVLYLSTNTGTTWAGADAGMVATGITATGATAISFDPTSPATTIVVATNNGIYRTISGPSGPWVQSLSGTVNAMVRSSSSPGTLYASFTANIYRSVDFGASWVFRGTNPGGTTNGLVVSPSGAAIFASTATNGVYVSTDGGVTWIASSAGITNQTSLCLTGDPSGNLFLGTNGGPSFISSDGGSSWSPMGNGLTTGSIYAFAVDPSNPGTVYAVGFGSTYKTTNSGATWVFKGSSSVLGVSGYSTASLTVAPTNPNVLYAGSNLGVYVSTNGGTNWTQVGPPTQAVDSMNAVAVSPVNAAIALAGLSSLTSDSLVAKLNAATGAIVYSTYLGGSGTDVGYGVATDGSGNAYLAGYTSANDFPVTPGALNSSFRSSPFVAKVTSGSASCTYSVKTNIGIALGGGNSQFLYSSGGGASFSVMAPGGCAWSAGSGVPWITVASGSSGSGPGSVYATMASNTTTATRTGTVTIAGLPNTITQAASGCTYTINSSSGTVTSAGGSLSVALTAGATCDWTVTNIYPWLTVTSSLTGTGNGTISLLVAPSTATNLRTASLSIAGKTYSITEGGTCSYTLPVSKANLARNGGAGSFAVTASAASCAWSASSSNTAWLTVNSFTGYGSGTVSYTASINATPVSRTATISVPGGSFSVFQAPLAADFNNDGFTDIIWQDPVTGLAQVWYLGGAQGTTIIGAANLTNSNPWRIVGVGDFNRDGRPDVVWQDPVSGAVQVWFLGGAGGNVVTGAAVLSYGNAWRIMSVADFNGDGNPDCIWQDPVTGLAQIWFFGGAQGVVLQNALNLTASNTWRIAGTGDFNGDGVPDVIWQDPVTGATQVWYLGGAQGNIVIDAANLAGANSWRISAVSDFNKDGRPDVILQDPVSGTSQIWLLGGAQGLTITGTPSLGGPNPWRIMGPR